jgi:hypothetical protein
MKKLDTKVLEGWVDLTTATVHGIYTQLQMDFYMPRDWFHSAKICTAEETAAVMLHEIGHAFTFLEYLDRTVTTNQAMAALVRSLDHTLGSDDRRAMVFKASALIKADPETQEALLKARNEKEVAVIVMDSEIQRSRSDLDCNVYDLNSSEMLADQFAVRHGAGQHLATALDKLMGGGTGTLGRLIGTFLGVVMLAIFTVYTLGLLIVLLAFATRGGEIYDRPYQRFQRMLLQNRERLKERGIGDDEKQRLLEQNEAIDAIMQKYPESMLGVFETVSWLLSSSYRKAYRHEQLQIELEKLAGNALFDQAAKFSTL